MIKNLTLEKARELLDSNKMTATELIEETLAEIKTKKDLNAYITLNAEGARRKAKIYDEDPAKFSEKPLAGIPIAVKDVFCTKGLRTTCASHMIEDFVPPYESTVTQRIADAGGIIIGKTNLDEFCHGSSTETSAFGPVKNPWDHSRLPGGSSGGSAAATAADLCVASIGTETGGSLRQPASWSGVVGLKPTYGRTSRYGVIAMASSLDTPGPITKNVRDAALMLRTLSRKDPLDATSHDEPVPDYLANLDLHSIRSMTIGIPREFIESELEDGVADFPLDESIRTLEKLGATVKDVSLLHPKHAIAVYAILQRSEVSSNLARFTGVRYGSTGDPAETYEEFFDNSRGRGFGNEPKRRIMTGTYTLSAGYHDKYYKKALSVQQYIERDFAQIFSDVDIIAGPATPSVAMKAGSTQGNPLFGEIADQLLEPSSLAHLPGISIPCGLHDGLPIGIQFVGPKFEEQRILDAAYAYEQETMFTRDL